MHECWLVLFDCVLHACHIDLEELILSPKMKRRCWQSVSWCETLFFWKIIVKFLHMLMLELRVSCLERHGFFNLCLVDEFWHQDVRAHGNFHMMWNFFLWRSNRICFQVIFLAWCVFQIQTTTMNMNMLCLWKDVNKFCSHCRPFYVLMPRREGDGECILLDVEFGTMEVKKNGHLFPCDY